MLMRQNYEAAMVFKEEFNIGCEYFFYESFGTKVFPPIFALPNEKQ